MKKAMIQTAKWFGDDGAAQQKFSMPFTLSLMGHVIFCLLFIGLPRFGFINTPHARIVNVQLVSVAAPERASTSAPEPKAPEPKAPEPKAEPAPAPKQEPAVAAKPTPKDVVSLAPKKEIEKKQSMKNKTYKKERVLESAIKNIEKRVDSSTPDPIRQALDRIQKNLKEEDRYVSTDDARGATAAGASGGKPTSDVQLAYFAEVQVSINRNWAFNEQMAGGAKNLYNLVVIKIMRSGEIKDVWFDRRSGNSYFDDSTYKAILKSSPLPPIPREITGSSIEVGFRFIPEGLK